MDESDKGQHTRVATDLAPIALEVLDRRRALIGMSRSAYLRHVLLEDLPPMIPVFNQKVWCSLDPAMQALVALSDRVNEINPPDVEKLSEDLRDVASCIRVCRRQLLGLVIEDSEDLS